MTHRIREQWDSYRREVIPKDAHDVQIVESRRAFYAGAAALLRILVDLDPGDEPTEDDLRKMDEINEEIDSFKRDVKGGRA